MTPEAAFEAWCQTKEIPPQDCCEWAHQAWLAACAWQRARDAEIVQLSLVGNDTPAIQYKAAEVMRKKLNEVATAIRADGVKGA